MDGLTGFSEAIKGVFPRTEIQLCIVHQIRNSLRYVAGKTQKEFMNDLKPVYCTCRKIGQKWTAPLQNRVLTISQLDVYFEGRLKLQIDA